MKEYDQISDFTKTYLRGDLYKLTMEYSKPENLIVSIVYEDEYDTFYDYNFAIQLKSHKMIFRGHECLKSLFKLSLKRDSNFEEEVSKCIYSTI